ncbi:MAG: ATP-binding protein [Chlamydiia bacterium]|nr:ATP-binding protein [Chlamydiia bacterium]
MYQRTIIKRIETILKRGKSILLLGPRQTGKTTLLQTLPLDRYISLAKLANQVGYREDLSRLEREVEALASRLDHLPVIAIDEIQKIPLLTDAVQDLIDRGIAQFILTGSSARKLRRENKLNLLPGRVIPLHMDPLMLTEIPKEQQQLEELLLYGSLPEVMSEPDLHVREELLLAYVSVFLDEEIRQEAAVRNLTQFAHFLRLAALESGKPLNFEKISQDVGVSSTTIASHYQILEDCLIAERIEPLSQSKTRKRLMKTPKYLLYDMGIRRIASEIGKRLPGEVMGGLFEEFVGLEILRAMHQFTPRGKLKFWRDANGPEVDWVVEHEQRFLPIEVKYTNKPTLSHFRHLKLFLNEYPAQKGYVICRIPYRQRFSDTLEAVPWRDIPLIIEEFYSFRLNHRKSSQT